MNQSIRTKLTLSYLAIALLTALLIYGLIRYTSVNRLKALILEQQLAEIRDEVTVWYEAEGDWDGFEAYFRTLHPPAPRPRQGDNASPRQEPTNLRRPPGMHGVLTADKEFLIGAQSFNDGDFMPESFSGDLFDIEVGGEIIAYILLDSETGVNLAAEEEIYLQRTNEVLLVAGIASIIVALLMGLLLARIFLRPITDLTHASRAMAAGDLQQRVPVRTDDELGELATAFNSMSTDLAEATQQRRQLTADIAHDLGTPLQVISGYLEGMQDGTLPLTDARLNTMVGEVEHLRHLVTDLDILSQTDTKTLRLEMQKLETADFLAHCQTAYTPLAQSEQIDLQTTIAPNLPPIHVDEKRLSQVMGNLINNAIRYTPAGGAITLRAQTHKNGVALQVQDSGSGIEQDDLPHIFNRFYRADTSRTEGGKMGLGLAISKALVEAMNGTISAASDEHGTTFTILLA